MSNPQEWDNHAKSLAGEVVFLLDMDGYRKNGKFQCKELGLKGLDCNKALSFHFYHGPYSQLTDREQQTARWIERNLFDIPYDAWWFGMLGSRSVPRVVAGVYDVEQDGHPQTWETKGTVAYKGGQVEKDLLDSLKIPSLNLEELGCPKMEVLAEEAPFLFDHCGHHKNVLSHCPQKEVLLFEWWFLRQCWHNGVTPRQKSYPRNPLESFLNSSDFSFPLMK
jgi:hypothetical protein